jgi:hypothetical protein
VYEKCINEAELILSTQKDSRAPVHKIWEEVLQRAKADGFVVASLSDFTAMLEGDRRFLIIPAKNKNQDDQEPAGESETGDSGMGELGFFSEDQVKLRAARVIEQSVIEDDEDIGSIRRRAFVSHETKKSVTAMKKNGLTASKKSVKPKSAKKSRKKPKPVRKANRVTNRKTKLRKRNKK